jgi:hypothetical protein
MKALKNANATLEDFEKYYYGEFDEDLLRFLIMFHFAENIYETHISDEQSIQMENKRKIKAKSG